ncbi:MAG TPA: helix-turn-helix transcriptional regulator [Gallionella sp.]|nr:helix-turn-helix transcriptional regulator [Gallionella sp.]
MHTIPSIFVHRPVLPDSAPVNSGTNKETRRAFAKALRRARRSRGLTQEDFSIVSSRTYLSTLERGQKSPTLDKINVISQTIGIHFLSLLALAYLYSEKSNDVDSLLARIKLEVASIHRDEATQS